MTEPRETIAGEPVSQPMLLSNKNAQKLPMSAAGNYRRWLHNQPFDNDVMEIYYGILESWNVTEAQVKEWGPDGDFVIAHAQEVTVLKVLWFAILGRAAEGELERYLEVRHAARAKSVKADSADVAEIIKQHTTKDTNIFDYKGTFGDEG